MPPKISESLENSARILIVEDDEDDFIITRDYLDETQFSSFDITRAINAQEGIRELSSDTYDLCILDYQLGAVNGLDVLFQSRELNITCPIIMLTGQADEALDNAALDAGAVDYLVKSEINSSRFIRSIRYALSRRDLELERVERLKAEAENDTKNRFLAHLSHELRTPLTSILGYTELLLDSEAGKTAGAELQVILRNGQHLLDLLNDVLDLSKIAANKLELNLNQIDLNSLIVDTYSLLRVSAIDKGLTLTVDTSNDVPTQINTDGTRLRQILINIINNAIKFTDVGGISIKTSLATQDEKELLQFEVRDTGVGIPKEKLASIFNPFEQVTDVVSKSIGGSGLGLAISSELAQRLGGSIRVVSEIDKGSTFVIRIDPGDITNVLREKLIMDTPDDYVQKVPTIALHGRVLVVDDLRDIRKLVGHIVQRAGCDISYASNGLNAIASVKTARDEMRPFDAILMDIHMPQMSGEEAVEHIRQHDLFDGPIIALTAAGLLGTRERLMAIGFTDSLSKPVNTEKLITCLGQYLPMYNPLTKNTQSSKKDNQAKSDTIKILLVEDDDDAAEAIKMLLESQGSEVHIAHSASEFNHLAYTNDWDIVLLDLNLPDAHGLDIAKDIRDSSNTALREVYIALISGEHPDRNKMQSLKINHRLMKPIQSATLTELLEHYRRTI